MLYTGQLDVIVALPLTEAMLQTVPWAGLDQYQHTKRSVWRVQPGDTEVAGYVRNVKNFYQVSSTVGPKSWSLLQRYDLSPLTPGDQSA